MKVNNGYFKTDEKNISIWDVVKKLNKSIDK